MTSAEVEQLVRDALFRQFMRSSYPGSGGGSGVCLWLENHGGLWGDRATGTPTPTEDLDRVAQMQRRRRLRFSDSRSFDNVRKIVRSDQTGYFRYVEGVATLPSFPRLIEVHSWVGTPSGHVIDPTWFPDKSPPDWMIYFGGEFTRADLRDHAEAFTRHKGMMAAVNGGRIGLEGAFMLHPVPRPDSGWET